MFRKLMVGLLVLAAVCGAMGTAWASPGDLVLFGPDENGVQKESVDGACIVGDVVYIKGNAAIFQWKPGDAEPTKFYEFASEPAQPAEGTEVTPAAEPAAPAFDAWSFRFMANWNEKLVAACASDGEIYEMTQDGPVKTGRKIDATTLSGASGDLNNDFYLIESIAFVGDKLFAVSRATENDWNSVYLCAVDEAGKMTPLSAQNERVMAIAPYKEGKLLVAIDRSMSGGQENQYAQLQVWDIASAKFEGASFAPNESWNLGALAYDAASDTIYLGQGTNISRCKFGEKAESVNFLGRELYNARGASGLIGDKLMIPSYDGVIVASVDPSLIPTTVLTVTGDWSSDQALAKFMAAHPEVAVNRVDSNIYNMETLQTALAAGGAPDIFRFGTYSDLGQLFSKGYAADLSGNAELMERVKRLYPQIQEAIARDGKLYAFPMQFEAGMWCYDQKALDALGLKFPETFPELLDLMAEWEDDYQDEAGGRQLIEPYMVEKTQLFYRILEQYVAQNGSEDKAITFNTPEFKEVMTALERSPIKQMTPEEQQQTYSYSYEDGGPIIETYAGFWYGRSSKTMVLPPKLTANSEPFAPASVYVYVVNPQTEHFDLALAYINYMAEHGEVSMRYMMYPDLMEPVENRYFKENVESMKTYLTELEAKTVEPSEQRDHEAQIAEMKKELENQEQWRWEISPEAIEEYRALAPLAKVAGSNLFYGDAGGELSKIIERYQQKQLSLDQMVRELDQKAQMIFLETR